MDSAAAGDCAATGLSTVRLAESPRSAIPPITANAPSTAANQARPTDRSRESTIQFNHACRRWALTIGELTDRGSAAVMNRRAFLRFATQAGLVGTAAL